MELRFWRSETFRVWIQYVAVGISLIPIGLMYVALSGTLGQKPAFYISMPTAVIGGLLLRMLLARVVNSRVTRAGNVLGTRAEFLSNRLNQNTYARRTSLGAGFRFDAGFNPGASQAQEAYPRTTLTIG